MARPSMRLFTKSLNDLERIHHEHRRVLPTLVEHFLTSHKDAFASVFLEHQVRGRAENIIDRVAGIEAAQFKVARRLNADAAAETAFAGDNFLTLLDGGF